LDLPHAFDRRREQNRTSIERFYIRPLKKLNRVGDMGPGLFRQRLGFWQPFANTHLFEDPPAVAALASASLTTPWLIAAESA
jgi:hypothetical protein